MRTLIALSGDIADPATCLRIARTCSLVICADGGAKHLRALGIVPDRLVGDMDSIDGPSSVWMESRRVDIRRFPVEKDWTDSELAVNAALEAGTGEGDEIWMIGAIGDRLDHMLANLGMAAALCARRIRTWLTDGMTYITALRGPDELRIDPVGMGLANPLVSVIPVPGAELSGVTLDGLVYPLEDATLQAGSTCGVSNRVREGAERIAVRVKKGEGFVTLTPSER